MTERTEEERATQAPIVVVFGGEPYDVAPLVIRDSRGWRARVGEILAGLPAYVKVDSDDPEAFAKSMTGLLADNPDKVIDLIFDYAKALNRAEIEAVATDVEMADAFGQLVAATFPLAGSLTKALRAISQ